MKTPSWFVAGCLSLGLLIGFMVGLSISPIVSTVLGLVFAFTGGSVIVLIKGREEHELRLIGKSLTAISLAMLGGVVLGISFRVNDLLNVDKSSSTTTAQSLQQIRSTPFYLDKPLSISDIIALSKQGAEPGLIRALLRAGTKGLTQRRPLTFDDLTRLVDKKNKVNAKVVQALFDGQALYANPRLERALPDIEQLVKAGVPAQAIMQWLSNEPSDKTTAAQAGNNTGNNNAQEGTHLYQGKDDGNILERFQQ